MLTDDQIQFLYTFCEKHYVRYYDLQVELVDHLANAVEEKMQQNSKLHFEQALNEVYKGFGVMGFAPVISEKLNALQKNVRKENWRMFVSYFTIPRISITILITLLLLSPFYFFSISDIDLLFSLYVLAVSIIAIAGTIYFAKKYKRPKRKLLLLNASTFFAPFGLLLQMPNVYFNIVRQASVASEWTVIFMTVFSVLIIVLSLAFFEGYKKLYNRAKTDYPLAFS